MVYLHIPQPQPRMHQQKLYGSTNSTLFHFPVYKLSVDMTSPFSNCSDHSTHILGANWQPVRLCLPNSFILSTGPLAFYFLIISYKYRLSSKAIAKAFSSLLLTYTSQFCIILIYLWAVIIMLSCCLDEEC